MLDRPKYVSYSSKIKFGSMEDFFNCFEHIFTENDSQVCVQNAQQITKNGEVFIIYLSLSTPCSTGVHYHTMY